MKTGGGTRPDPRRRVGVDVGATLVKLALRGRGGPATSGPCPPMRSTRSPSGCASCAPRGLGAHRAAARRGSRARLARPRRDGGRVRGLGRGRAPAARRARRRQRYLLVSVGTGTSVMLGRRAGACTRVGGTALGGGTIVGLGARAAARERDFAEIVALAQRGDRRRVDLLVSDIYPAGEILLPRRHQRGELRKARARAASRAGRRRPRARDHGSGRREHRADLRGARGARRRRADRVRRLDAARESAAHRDPRRVSAALGRSPLFLADGQYAGAIGALALAEHGRRSGGAEGAVGTCVRSDAGLGLRVAVAQRGLGRLVFFAARHRAQRALGAGDRGALNAQLLALRGHLALELLARFVRLVEARLEGRDLALEVLEHARDVGCREGAAEPPMRAAGGLVRRSTGKSISWFHRSVSLCRSGSPGISPASSKSESSAAAAQAGCGCGLRGGAGAGHTGAGAAGLSNRPAERALRAAGASRCRRPSRIRRTGSPAGSSSDVCSTSSAIAVTSRSFGSARRRRSTSTIAARPSSAAATRADPDRIAREAIAPAPSRAVRDGAGTAPASVAPGSATARRVGPGGSAHCRAAAWRRLGRRGARGTAARTDGAVGPAPAARAGWDTAAVLAPEPEAAEWLGGPARLSARAAESARRRAGASRGPQPAERCGIGAATFGAGAGVGRGQLPSSALRARAAESAHAFGAARAGGVSFATTFGAGSGFGVSCATTFGAVGRFRDLRLGRRRRGRRRPSAPGAAGCCSSPRPWARDARRPRLSPRPSASARACARAASAVSGLCRSSTIRGGSESIISCTRRPGWRSAMCARALVPASTFTPRTSPVARSSRALRRCLDRDPQLGRRVGAGALHAVARAAVELEHDARVLRMHADADVR